MADFILATLLLAGGLFWGVISLMAGANHPTGGNSQIIASFYTGCAVAVLGLLYWGYNIYNLVN